MAYEVGDKVRIKNENFDNTIYRIVRANHNSPYPYELEPRPKTKAGDYTTNAFDEQELQLFARFHRVEMGVDPSPVVMKARQMGKSSFYDWYRTFTESQTTTSAFTPSLSELTTTKENPMDSQVSPDQINDLNLDADTRLLRAHEFERADGTPTHTGKEALLNKFWHQNRAEIANDIRKVLATAESDAEAE